jgi:hypothetical protein
MLLLIIILLHAIVQMNCIPGILMHNNLFLNVYYIKHQVIRWEVLFISLRENNGMQ